MRFTTFSSEMLNITSFVLRLASLLILLSGRTSQVYREKDFGDIFDKTGSALTSCHDDAMNSNYGLLSIYTTFIHDPSNSFKTSKTALRAWV